ncbi:hypothetical protein EB75_17700 [Mycobacterium sp. ST-F2]|uniref:hypothetical protein n=1 Tax=Mycobacterium sp. ST-F2 TaxID=1490484 RepID=UPI00093CCB0A|nr:hypothetical protein [Mycobacterium sp. ST-F2]OKH81307.1 hypothetical protein EB75_17700 [Mycobacterium sp. ST-F2]
MLTGRHVRRGTVAVLLILPLVAAGASPGGLPRVVRVVTGEAQPADRMGRSDEDQIRDTLRAISDSYNRQDVRSAQLLLCAPARSQWNAGLERVWMRFRRDHGVMQFTVDSVLVRGTQADVSGTQMYANDAVPKPFTAKFGRGPHGWRMCSST